MDSIDISNVMNILIYIVIFVTTIIIIAEIREGLARRQGEDRANGYVWLIFALEFCAIIGIMYAIVYIPSISWSARYVIFIACFITVNIVALLLSYRYFNGTQCYPDEVNIVARFLYIVFGEDIGHIILFIFRTGLTIYIIRDLWLYPINAQTPITGTMFYPVYFTYATITSIFTVELLANIYANTFPSDPCGDQSKLCKLGIVQRTPALKRMLCTPPAFLKKHKRF